MEEMKQTVNEVIAEKQEPKYLVTIQLNESHWHDGIKKYVYVDFVDRSIAKVSDIDLVEFTAKIEHLGGLLRSLYEDKIVNVTINKV
jgi:hypothetical protein